MDHFQYKKDKLFAEAVDIQDIAKAVGTPFYCYSAATIRRHFDVFSKAFKNLEALICYAVKANSNQAVLRLLAREGAGADIVSLGELYRALDAGIAPEKIVFSGVGKTVEELEAALTHNIYQINVESYVELCALEEVANNLGVVAPIALRLNPDVEAGTHEKISTGRSDNKFGIPFSELPLFINKIKFSPVLKWQGVAVHIGSQLTDLAPYRKAFEQIRDLVAQLAQQDIIIESLDLGGGLGISYHTEMPPLPEDYAQLVNDVFKDLSCRFVFEPGRMIVGNAGILVTKILYIKETEKKFFVIVDAAMNDLLRPSLYDAYHHIIPLQKNTDGTFDKPVDVVGPVCETGDSLAINRSDFPKVRQGDFLCIRSTGAYGAVMSSTYNTRPLITETMVHENFFDIIRKRQTYNELLGLDIYPEWLQD